MPGDVKTTDAARLQAAFVSCLECLMGDLRIEAPYQAWLVHRDIARLERRALAWQGTPQQQQYTGALWQALYRIPDPDEIEAVSQVLREMGVPWPWVAPALVCAAFPVTLSNTRLPADERRDLGAVVQMVATATPGRLPTEDGNRIRRHVDWWYRRKIKHPPDSLRELEQKELTRTGQQTIARRHSTVIQGIQQAEYLLELWEPGPYHPPEFY